MGFLFIPLFALVSLSGHAWSENIGWVGFAGPGYQATIDEETGAFGGYAWSENVGWIKLTGDTARVCSATEGGDCSSVISPNSGDWDGIVKLKGATYGPKVVGTVASGCSLAGYAWGSDVVGWLHFNGPTYKVGLAKCILPVEPPHVFDLACSFNAGPKVLISPQKTSRLTWECQDADECRILPTVGKLADPSRGGVTVTPPRTTIYTLKCGNEGGQSVEIAKTVTVIKSQLCEINPADPSCR